MSWSIKEHEKAKYDQIFDGLLPINGLLSGEKVKPILLNSKLPISVLGMVWELSDIDRDGMLDRDEFCIAMHLVYKTLEKVPLPQTLPLELIPPSKRNAHTNIQPAISKIMITAAEKAHYDSLFKQYDSDNDGLVGGADVKEVFLNTGLSQNVLAHIWNLIDLTSSGKLNKEQFQLAMCLVHMKLQGYSLPLCLSPDMLPSSIHMPVPEEPLSSAGDSSNIEADLIAEEINVLKNEKMCLEKEVAQNEADIKLHEREALNIHKEFESSQLSQKQLECRKVEAQKRSTELDEKKKKLQSSVADCKNQFQQDQLKIQELRHKLSNSKPMSQEEETAKLRKEIENLASEEADVETRYMEAINTEKRLNERIKVLEELLAQSSSGVATWQNKQELFLSDDPFNNFDPFPKSQNDPFGGDSLGEHFSEHMEREGPQEVESHSTDPWGDSANTNGHSSQGIVSATPNQPPLNDTANFDSFDPFGQGSFQPLESSQLPSLPPKKIKSPAPPRPPAPKPSEESLSAANLTAVKLLHNEGAKSKSMLEAEQLAWAKKDSEQEYRRMKKMEEREQQELELALALSRL